MAKKKQTEVVDQSTGEVAITAVLINGQLLLGKKADKLWAMPQDKLKKGEASSLYAASRASEQLGVRLRRMQGYGFIDDSSDNPKVFLIDDMFENEPKADGKIMLSLKWFDARALLLGLNEDKTIDDVTKKAIKHLDFKGLLKSKEEPEEKKSKKKKGKSDDGTRDSEGLQEDED